MANTNEPTRPIGPATPGPNGTIKAKTWLSPKECRVRARLDVPPSKVMPIIVVPGIMGTNLRASTLGDNGQDAKLKPGEIAWRPPNTVADGLKEVSMWKNRDPAERQNILYAPSLEVDPDGAILSLSSLATTADIEPEQMRSYGWGEIHWASYGQLLVALKHFFSNFMQYASGAHQSLSPYWEQLNKFPREGWGKSTSVVLSTLQMPDIEQLAKNWYPVYAFGYNWLESNEQSAASLVRKIESIIGHWSTQEYSCEKVLIITHSMGGLVARACAKQVPDKVAGIVHACMPAHGAPVCYRRISCGTEASSPSNSWIANLSASAFADIAGRTAAETQPVMARSPGALELLPTHRYPQPWLMMEVSAKGAHTPVKYRLPCADVYSTYLDTSNWYRLFIPELLDPAGVFGDNKAAVRAMRNSVLQAKRFHTQVLDCYLHPNSYVLYGSDANFASYGTFSWRCTAPALKISALTRGIHIEALPDGGRLVLFEGQIRQNVIPSMQDEVGDGTVPERSANVDISGAKEKFRLAGFSHQGVFCDRSALMLTIQLAARAILAS